MKIYRDVPALRTYRQQLLFANRKVGFVPTMGALHEGHLSLMRLAAYDNDEVFVSIYVNPTQFGINEDLDTYPKTWEADQQAINALNEELESDPNCGKVTTIFAPTTRIMYPNLPPSSEISGPGSFVNITPLGNLLEGSSRPVFFRGVATVCMKLFNIVRPDRVYFGQKDIQQTIVVKRMVSDFHLDMDVKIGPIVRDSDGLALSSRNVYLGTRRRNVAKALYQALLAAEAQYSSGNRARGSIINSAIHVLNRIASAQETLPRSERALFEIDYISLADPDDLKEIEIVDDTKGAILSGAIRMKPIDDPQVDENCGLGCGAGAVRLIDNIILNVNQSNS